MPIPTSYNHQSQVATHRHDAMLYSCVARAFIKQHNALQQSRRFALLLHSHLLP